MKFNYIKNAARTFGMLLLMTAPMAFTACSSSDEAFFNEMRSISDVVKGLTGEESKIIRFPGGSNNTVSNNYSYGIMDTLTRSVSENGYVYFVIL